MSPRRLRSAALTAVGAALVGAGVLGAQAAAALRRPYADPDTAPPISGSVGDTHNPPLRLVLLGDSTAAGVGVVRAADTVAGRVASRLARRGWLVQLASVAVTGSRAGDLGPQVSRALLGNPDLALILVGVHDATRLSALPRMRQHLGQAVLRLRDADVRVVVGLCPDLGAVRAVHQPLRWLLAWRGRAVARNQAEAVAAAGGVAVDVAALTGPVFRADRGTFSADAFHPNSDGYRLWADAVHPAVETVLEQASPHDRT